MAHGRVARRREQPFASHGDEETPRVRARAKTADQRGDGVTDRFEHVAERCAGQRGQIERRVEPEYPARRMGSNLFAVQSCPS